MAPKRAIRDSRNDYQVPEKASVPGCFSFILFLFPHVVSSLFPIKVKPSLLGYELWTLKNYQAPVVPSELSYQRSIFTCFLSTIADNLFLFSFKDLIISSCFKTRCLAIDFAWRQKLNYTLKLHYNSKLCLFPSKEMKKQFKQSNKISAFLKRTVNRPWWQSGRAV